MYCFNLRLLIHNHTRLDYSYRTSACEFWLTSVSLIFYTSLSDLAEDGQPFIHLMGWLRSHNFGWGINTRVKACVCTHKRTDLSGRFDWKEICFFSLSSFLHKTPCEINATQTKHLDTAHRSSGTLNYGEAWGRWKLLFYFICCFPFSPSQALVGDGTSKASSY